VIAERFEKNWVAPSGVSWTVQNNELSNESYVQCVGRNSTLCCPPMRLTYYQHLSNRHSTAMTVYSWPDRLANRDSRLDSPAPYSPTVTFRDSVRGIWEGGC